MSQVVACRNCGSQWTLPPQVTGQIPCPKCGQSLLASSTAAVVTPPPPPPRQPPPPQTPPATPSPGTNPVPQSVNLNLRGKYRAAALRTFQESNSPLDLFDWKFEKYLTPWIVRITWIAVLLMTALWLFFLMVSFTLSFLPEIAASTPPNAFGTSPRLSPTPRMETAYFGSPRVWLMVGRIIALATSLVTTIIGLLWLRVALESAIVLFHIAKSLASINEKTGPAEATT